MAQFPSMPLWTDALVADTGHLSDTEFGAYMKILIAMWRAPECRLPNNPEILARKFQKTLADFNAVYLPLLREFCSTSGNWWTQKRLKREWEYLVARREKQRDKANTRWNKEKEVCRGNAPRVRARRPDAGARPRFESDNDKQLDLMDNDVCRGNAASGNALSTPTPTPPYEEGIEPSSISDSDKKRFVLPDWIPRQDWQDYKEMRQRIKKPMTKKAMDMAVSKLDALRKKGHDPSTVLQQSTFQSWQGLFEPKDTNYEKSRPNGANGAGTSKTDRAKAAVMRAAESGGYAPPRHAGQSAFSDDAVSVFSNAEIIREGT